MAPEAGLLPKLLLSRGSKEVEGEVVLLICNNQDAEVFPNREAKSKYS